MRTHSTPFISFKSIAAFALLCLSSTRYSLDTDIGTVFAVIVKKERHLESPPPDLVLDLPVSYVLWTFVKSYSKARSGAQRNHIYYAANIIADS